MRVAVGALALAVALGVPPFFELVTALPGFAAAVNTRLPVLTVLAVALLAAALPQDRPVAHSLTLSLASTPSPVDPAIPTIAIVRSLIAALRKLMPGNVWTATLSPADEGIAVDGKLVRDLPPSAADKLRPQSHTQRAQPYKPIARTFAPTYPAHLTVMTFNIEGHATLLKGDEQIEDVAALPFAAAIAAVEGVDSLFLGRGDLTAAFGDRTSDRQVREASDQAGVGPGGLTAVGVGSPGIVDDAEGTVTSARNLPDWEGEFGLGAALLAKAVTTLDVLSGGRAILGLGAGWNEEESRGLGFPFPPLAARFERREDADAIETLQATYGYYFDKGLWDDAAALFAAAMGLLWLSAVPPTSGLLALMFGTRYMATLFGLVFLNHQVGAFVGVWLGGTHIVERPGTPVSRTTAPSSWRWTKAAVARTAAAVVRPPGLPSTSSTRTRHRRCPRARSRSSSTTRAQSSTTS